MLASYISRGVLHNFKAEALCLKAPLKSPLLSFLKPRCTSTTAGVSTAAVIAFCLARFQLEGGRPHHTQWAVSAVLSLRICPKLTRSRLVAEVTSEKSIARCRRLDCVCDANRTERQNSL